MHIRLIGDFKVPLGVSVWVNDVCPPLTDRWLVKGVFLPLTCLCCTEGNLGKLGEGRERDLTTFGYNFKNHPFLQHTLYQRYILFCGVSAQQQLELRYCLFGFFIRKRTGRDMKVLSRWIYFSSLLCDEVHLKTFSLKCKWCFSMDFSKTTIQHTILEESNQTGKHNCRYI